MQVCNRCRTVYDDHAKFCSKCGSGTFQAKAAGPGVNVGGGIFGFVYGTSMAIWAFIVGVFLCATGIGALIGVPLMIAGVLMPFLGAAKGAAILNGPCPWCGHRATGSPPGFNCAACRNRVIVRGKFFMKAPH
jgi:hypothetical protein